MQDNAYFKRCFDLAQLGNRQVRPNPKVGAVIVYKNRIIGEGYHKVVGSHHAEVNAIQNIKSEDKKLLDKSTIFISLEPCHHYGATPPCVDLIIKYNIPKIRIALIDPTEKVHLKSINKLKDLGRDVEVLINNKEANVLISEFKTIHIKKRPFVQIKLAKSADNYIGQEGAQVHISNQYSNIYTHKLRAYTDAILIGTNTALIDNPSLTLRNYPGKQPHRIVLDRHEKLQKSCILLADHLPTIIVTEKIDYTLGPQKTSIVLDFDDTDFLTNLCNRLLELNIYHIMLEGGAQLIKSFLKQNLWDEAHVISTPKKLYSGTKAPNIHGLLHESIKLNDNTVHIIKN